MYSLSGLPIGRRATWKPSHPTPTSATFLLLPAESFAALSLFYPSIYLVLSGESFSNKPLTILPVLGVNLEGNLDPCLQ